MISTDAAQRLAALRTGLAARARRVMPATAIVVALAALSLGAYAGHAARRGASMFTVTAAPGRDTIAAGSTAGYGLRIHRRHFSGAVRFRLARPLPAGFSAHFVPRHTRGSRATLTVRTADSMAEGTYRLVLQAKSGGVKKALELTLTVAGPSGGSGSGSVALPAFTVSGNAAQLLEPGAPQAINLRITNPNAVPLSVTAVSTRVQAVSAPHATPSLPCTLGDFSVAQYSGPLPLTIPAASNRTLAQLGVPASQWPQVAINDLPSNQDGCQGATVTLAYSGIATVG